MIKILLSSLSSLIIELIYKGFASGHEEQIFLLNCTKEPEHFKPCAEIGRVTVNALGQFNPPPRLPFSGRA